MLELRFIKNHLCGLFFKSEMLVITCRKVSAIEPADISLAHNNKYPQPLASVLVKFRQLPFEKKLAGIGRHGFGYLMIAVWTSNR
ncbi:hypothetical protein [Methylomarinum vadi]|uniref:hypothetical protein n=1 Tax=Methylomarinum vadi TaxID=438855 RepID=UPI0013647E21|nr:hypothetical protein [Methylomarinum vadi]